MKQPNSADDQSVSNLFSILDRPMRRQVLEFLASNPTNEADLQTLVDHLLELHSEDDHQVDRDRILLRLHHVHLPKLADAGVIEYDVRDGHLQYQPDDDLERCLNSTNTSR